MSKRTELILAVALMLSTAGFSQEPAKTNPAETKAVAASLNPAAQEAAKLLLYSVALSAQAGEIIDIPREIADRYNSVAKTVGFSIPGGVVAVGTLISLKGSLDEFKSVLGWINVVLQYAAKGWHHSARYSGQVSDAIGLTWFGQQSSKMSNRVYDAFIAPVIRLSSNRGVAWSVGTTSGLSSLGGSSYIIFNGPAEVMSRESARNLFGYNDYLSKQIDAKVTELAYVYSLKPGEAAVVKDAIRTAILETAVKNEFRRDATYNLDIVEILKSKQLISSEQVAAADMLRSIVNASTSAEVGVDTQAQLGRSITVVLATQAILETMIESNRLSLESEKEARQMLGNSQRVVKRILGNLVQ